MGKKINSDNNIWYIYYLFDPRNNELRYIGKTIDPTRRFADHLKDPEKSKKDDWIKELISLELLPIMKIMEECERTDGLRRETFHIRQAIINGSNLLNANSQSLNLNKSTIIDVIVPNKALFIIEELGKSKKMNREKIITQILVDFTEALDLKLINSDIENFADFVNNHNNKSDGNVRT